MSRWYIIHAYSGFENKVKEQILADAARMGLDKLVEEAFRMIGVGDPDAREATVRPVLVERHSTRR